MGALCRLRAWQRLSSRRLVCDWTLSSETVHRPFFRRSPVDTQPKRKSFSVLCLCVRVRVEVFCVTYLSVFCSSLDFGFRHSGMQCNGGMATAPCHPRHVPLIDKGTGLHKAAEAALQARARLHSPRPVLFQRVPGVAGAPLTRFATPFETMVLYLDEIPMAKRPLMPPTLDNREVFVDPFPCDGTEELNQWLEMFGEVDEVYRIPDQDRGYVVFKKPSAAAKCVATQAGTWSESERAIAGQRKMRPQVHGVYPENLVSLVVGHLIWWGTSFWSRVCSVIVCCWPLVPMSVSSLFEQMFEERLFGPTSFLFFKGVRTFRSF